MLQECLCHVARASGLCLVLCSGGDERLLADLGPTGVPLRLSGIPDDEMGHQLTEWFANPFPTAAAGA